jgi:hypothetical protein
MEVVQVVTDRGPFVLSPLRNGHVLVLEIAFGSPPERRCAILGDDLLELPPSNEGKRIHGVFQRPRSVASARIVVPSAGDNMAAA